MKKGMSKWMKIVVAIIDGQENIPSPFDKDGIIKSVFVTHDKGSQLGKIGYLMFWCSVTNKGAIFSRVKVPANAEYVYGDELQALGLPDIKLQQVKF